MKTRVFSILSLAFLMALGLNVNAQDETYLCAYFAPAPSDNAGVSSLSKYRIFLTEKTDGSYSDMQQAIINDSSLLGQCTYICHPCYYNTDYNQYATADYSASSPQPSTLLDGRYSLTDNSVLVVVYNAGGCYGVNVIPQGDYTAYFDDQDDWGEPVGSGWAVNGSTQSIEEVEEYDYKVFVQGRSVVVKGVEGKRVELFDLSGRKMATQVSSSDECSMRVRSAGVYVVRVDGKSTCVVAE